MCTLHHLSSLPFPSHHFTSLHFTLLHFSSLHITSLHFTSLHFPSLHITSLRFPSHHFSSLHITSLPFTSLLFTSLHFTLLLITLHQFTSLHFTLKLNASWHTVLWLLPALCPVLYLTLNSVHTAREVNKTETHLNRANDRTVRGRDADSPTASAIHWLETKPFTISTAITSDVTATSGPQFRFVTSPIPSPRYHFNV